MTSSVLFRSILALMIAMMIAPLIMDGAVSGQIDGAVKVGEPLHIYFRKDVAQQMLYLHFYKPAGNLPLTDTSSRFIIERKGAPNSTSVVFFPRDPNSNFLQFEPNASVAPEYQFMLFAATPQNASNNKAKLQLIIEIDYQRDNVYDKRSTTTLVFDANSTFVKVKGRLPIDAYELSKFDGKRGGKVRVTLARADDLDTIVVLHCGSSKDPSYIQLPCSKYRYVPSDRKGGGVSPFLVLGIGVAVVVVFFIGLKLLNWKTGKEAKDEAPARRRSGKRWSKKGKGR